MKTDLKILGLAAAAVLLAAPAARAQQAPAKIAIINIQNAILATKDGEKAREQIRVKFEPRSKEIEAAGAHYIRCRSKDGTAEAYAPRQMGPPPAHCATQSNRMSPAGVPMFYGALEEATALAETASSRDRFAVATFETRRDLILLDLRKVPAMPSIFAAPSSERRAWAKFMRDFLEDFRKPIARNGGEHVEYVPTQVVTEYFRTVAKCDGRSIDGILYASARREGATAVVLFADTHAVADPQMDSESVAFEALEFGATWLDMIDYREVTYDPETGKVIVTS